jgi:hypothetical protein
MNKVAHAFLTTLFFAVLTMLTAIAWSQHSEMTPTDHTPISTAN